MIKTIKFRDKDLFVRGENNDYIDITLNKVDITVFSGRILISSYEDTSDYIVGYIIRKLVLVLDNGTELCVGELLALMRSIGTNKMELEEYGIDMLYIYLNKNTEIQLTIVDRESIENFVLVDKNISSNNLTFDDIKACL